MPLENTAPVETVVVAPETPVAETPVDKPTEKLAEKPVSMEDSIKAKLKELNYKGPEGEPVGRPRAADGKFVAKTDEEKAEADKVEKPVEKPAEVDPVKAAADAKAAEAKVAAPGTEKAPTSWRKETQAKWDAVDPEIKAEIHKREADMHKGIEAYKEMANVGQLFDKEFRPYEAMIRAAGTTPQELTKSWLNVEYQLKTGSPEQKAAMFVEYAKVYGIDLEHITAAHEKIAAGQPAFTPVDPRVVELEKQIQQLTGTFEQQKNEVEQRDRAKIQDEVTAFAQGHPQYESVKLDMAALLKEGRAKDLEDAYNKAIRLTPEFLETQVAQRLEAERKKAAEKAAAARQAASTNVAVRGTLPAAPVVGTMEDSIKARLRELTGS